jgi:hypothetical protein
LRIAENSLATAALFKLHRADVPGGPGAAPTNTPDIAYPWYATDFDYNPFDYRQTGGYHAAGLEGSNSFKSKPYWSQPGGIYVVQFLDGSGCFLNSDSELSELPDGEPDPQLTTFLDSNTDVIISMNGHIDSSSDFQTTAFYYEEDPDNPGFFDDVPVTWDQSEDYFAYVDDRDHTEYQNGVAYSHFRPHKPLAVTDWSSNLKTRIPAGMGPGQIGNVFIYQLTDTAGAGMPGVWLQERFPGIVNGSGSAVPSNFLTNSDGGQWVTQRREYGNQWLTNGTMQDGVMNNPDMMFYNPQSPTLTLWHEYWAGTDKSARRIEDYPWRTIPGTTTKQWLGIAVGFFDMSFSTTAVTHNSGGRHSPTSPP